MARTSVASMSSRHRIRRADVSLIQRGQTFTASTTGALTDFRFTLNGSTIPSLYGAMYLWDGSKPTTLLWQNPVVHAARPSRLLSCGADEEHPRPGTCRAVMTKGSHAVHKNKVISAILILFYPYTLTGLRNRPTRKTRLKQN